MCPCLPASVRNYHEHRGVQFLRAMSSSEPGACGSLRFASTRSGRTSVRGNREEGRLPKCCGSAYRRLPCACLRRSGYDVVQWIRRGLVDFKTLMIMYFKSEFEPRRQYTRSTSTATSCQGHGLTAAASAPLASLLPSHYSYLCLGRGLSDRALRFPLQTARRDPNGHHRVVHCACTTTTAQSRYTKFARVITANSVRLDDVSRGRYV